MQWLFHVEIKRVRYLHALTIYLMIVLDAYIGRVKMLTTIRNDISHLRPFHIDVWRLVGVLAHVYKSFLF